MNTLKVTIDGQTCEVPVGISIAAALALSGYGVTRRSVSGERRAPFCGMGICQECRVTVNGRRVLACQTECQPEMVIERSQHANV
ncbi:(2Fe-2S)-binding protein [Citrobacter rodentium]|uniref:(2Fe-2S)-binding protein n=2 Tax=Citrobacter rodentium TaxID=67825 RepID=D2TUL6_CITRI|nr:(2Fe-2S)-binding protein [Citrobacter rodentium]KIQ49033.1 (2Fe-2S)-binding protein [Citrobacter rodentium]QBY29038.1 (2Fe-2S)-binding protein [Citrobacter rodentium]UHO29105.1 (2Fe-2S)-binding protein [Citrobacter rodentium NBRC 105723 = DSM 16636]CBG89285.1 conserved hypothetical protein [Citrobacter rodentium ICC168]HAT8014881.1 (2Fe-2S)-binding protein [Citrobacter rodentium NBRC 105723 = DSM 16636]